MTESPFGQPIPEGRASDADLDRVARNLERWQFFLAEQRTSFVPAPAWMTDYLDERGLTEQIQSASTGKQRLLAQLRVAYGEAVARVPGAEDEDLVILRNMGLLLTDPPEEKTASADPAPAPAASPAVVSALTLAEEGRAAQMRGDLDEAISYFTGALDGGHLDDSDIGQEVMHRLGWALQQQGDHKNAERWLTRAAEAGHLEAATSLGLALVQQGKTDEAIRWLTPAAEAGHVQAMTVLGLALRERSFALIERGVLAAGREAGAQCWIWIRKAADAGDATALSLVAEAEAYKREHERPTQTTAGPQSTTAPAKSGCYIATAVYGSYEAAPVLTLRRFRDERLARSATGRALIRVYYILSPHLVRHFERAGVWNRVARRILDAVVRHLGERTEALPADSHRACQ